MRTSENISDLAAALAKAQGAMRGAKKDATNPHLRNRYADLASCWDACREPLTANGLSVVQFAATEGGHVQVTTRLLHASGQWMESTLALPWSGSKGLTDAQAVGSALTYARRYGLMAMVGLAPDDEDDGASAGNRPAPQRQQQRQAPPKPAPPKPVEHPPTGEGHHESWKADQKRFFAKLKDLEWDYEVVKGLCSWMGQPKPSSLPQARRDALLDFLASEAGADKMNAFLASKGAA